MHYCLSQCLWSMSSIENQLQIVRERIAEAERISHRDANAVTLLAVSKTFGADAVLAAVAAGQRAFGENYVQEAVDKITQVKAQIPEIPLQWHFIGPIQSNKTKLIAEHFDWVHAIDREKIAQRLSEQRPTDLAPLQVCIQVNVSGEESKSGVLPEAVLALAKQIAALPNLQLRGLMAIPAPTENQVEQHAAFAQMRQLLDTLQQHGIEVDTLSMGMSADMEAAIEEGATIVRIGSAIFGHRNYQ